MFKRKKTKKFHIEADEIFLDSKNLPNFDTHHFEGRIEKTISKKSIYVFYSICLLVSLIFMIRLFNVQVTKGNYFNELSKNNALDKEIIFAPRGIIYDRNNKRLAWNVESENQKDFFTRQYIETPGFSHILGYVNYPKKDKKGFFWRPEYIGADGLEKQFNDTLTGISGAVLIEKKSDGTLLDNSMLKEPVPGENIVTTIDADIQSHMYQSIKKMADTSGYEGGAGAMIDLKTGELLSLVSFPEFNSNIITRAEDITTIENYFSDARKPLLNRAISGLYSPGSIIKPFMGIAALTEGVVTPNTKILSYGSISLPNPYNPSKKSVFVDYRPNNGWVNLKEALSVSSNIYFYNVGGGYQSQKGIGIDKIGEYIKKFGIASKTGVELPNEKEGVIPSISWKEKVFPGDPWRIGDTYNTSIGQYGYQVTPLQMLKAVSIIANKGVIKNPTLIKKDTNTEPTQKLEGIKEEYFDVVQSGMRLAVTSPIGTVKGLQNVSIPMAAKTGTAQVGVRNQYINSWIMGFFPYEKPEYAFVFLMDKGTEVNSPGATSAALDFFYWYQNRQKDTGLNENKEL